MLYIFSYTPYLPTHTTYKESILLTAFSQKKKLCKQRNQSQNRKQQKRTLCGKKFFFNKNSGKKKKCEKNLIVNLIFATLE